MSADGQYSSDFDRTGWAITYIGTPALKTIANTASGVQLTWGKVAGAASYRILIKSGSTWKKLADTKSVSYVHKAVKSGTKYTYSIRCLNAKATAYSSAYNTKGWAITFVATPKAPKLANTKSGVKVTFAAVKGAAKYRVMRKTGKGKWVKISDTTKLTVVDKTSKKGVTYRYTVRCMNKAGKFVSAYNNGSVIKCKR